MRRTVAETYAAREEWRCEFKDRAEGQRFVGWARAAGKLGPIVGDLADERREEGLFVAALKDWMASNGRPWVDLPENEERVDALLVQRLGARGQAADRNRCRNVVRTWRWKDRRLRRQLLGEQDLAYVANTIAKWIAQRQIEKAPSVHARKSRPEVTQGEEQDLGTEILRCLRADRWKAWTYNEVASAVGTDWRSALNCLRTLASGDSGVVTVGTGKGVKYRYTPEAIGWMSNGKEEGRVRRVAVLALAAIEHHVGISKRGLRELVRENLGTCASATVDAALHALVEAGLVIVQSGGPGLASRYLAVHFDDPQTKAQAHGMLISDCVYAERALRERRYGINLREGRKSEARRRS